MIGMPLTAFASGALYSHILKLERDSHFVSAFFSASILITNAVVFVCPLKESKRKQSIVYCYNGNYTLYKNQNCSIYIAPLLYSQTSEDTAPKTRYFTEDNPNEIHDRI